jgi:hypothetical protein
MDPAASENSWWITLHVNQRLWRLRKRQQSIDAIVREDDNDVTLEFVMNGKRVTARRWPSHAQAVKAASEKRAELERAGWATHW